MGGTARTLAARDTAGVMRTLCPSAKEAPAWVSGEAPETTREGSCTPDFRP